GWPITKSDLIPFYRRAQHVCQLGQYDYYELDTIKALVKARPLEFPAHRVQSQVVQTGRFLSFGKYYRRLLLRARNITTLIHANATDLETNETEIGRASCRERG